MCFTELALPKPHTTKNKKRKESVVFGENGLSLQSKIQTANSYFLMNQLDDVICGEKSFLFFFLQSVPAWVRAGWGGRWRRQRHGGRGIRWVVHGEDQAGAPDRHFVFRQAKLVVLVGCTDTRAGGGGSLPVDGAGARGVCADSDVGVHGADAGVVQDEVRVVVMQLAFVLVSVDMQMIRWKKRKKNAQ